MGELIRKELKGFFTSLSGYVILLFFLVANGLFLWVVPGAYNIPDSGMADLQPFFSLAPVLYLFLVPALCMRLFSEEIRTGTLELLFTRPVPIGRIVWAKYLAGLFLVLLSILPTWVYVVSLWLLAQPVGHIDLGGIVGSYIGLFFLSGVYVAVGTWASARTGNPIIAFIYAFVVSFLLYAGLDFIGEIPMLAEVQGKIQFWGIAYHYEPMSRGVIACSDVLYFVSFVFLFVWLTAWHFKGTRQRWWVVVLGCVVLNVAVARVVYWRADITNDKRYTLSENTRSLLERVDRPVQVSLFLAGNLPPGLQKLQYATTRMLEEFWRLSGHNFRYTVIDPAEVADAEEKKALVRYLAQRGIMPVNLNRRTEDETLSQQIIFPGAIVYDDSTEVSLNLLQNVPGLDADENINHSVEALEYELTKAVRLLMRRERKAVAFLVGQGELPYREVADMAKTLSYYYQVDFVSADSLAADPLRYEALIIARPTEDFSERDKFIVDQYAMNGGSLLWCIDEVEVEHEALKEQETVGAVYRPLNVEDMLFKYGVRINPELLLDGNCVLVPVVTGMNGTSPIYSPGNWYYSPLLQSGASQHPVTAGILPVRVDYANSIDTVGGDGGLKKTVLLATSRYTAALKTPCPVTLAITEERMTPEKFNRRHIPVAVAVEGEFPSLFRHRNMPGVVDAPFKRASEYNRMIFIADGDVIRNRVHGAGDNAVTVPLGYDEYSGQLYGNRDFLLNAVNWLCDDEGWMALRGRHLSFYLLDKTRLKAERRGWEALNVGLPLLFVALLSIGLTWWRRRNR